MGTVFSLPHARTTDLAGELRSLSGLELYAMTPDPGAVSIRSITPGDRVGIMIGSERSGLSGELLELATPVRIPMADGVDSLNAAAATAVGCFALGPRHR
jgi:tRNA G18 (ribose-2'-O)-methylase SpoU